MNSGDCIIVIYGIVVSFIGKGTRPPRLYDTQEESMSKEVKEECIGAIIVPLLLAAFVAGMFWLSKQ